MPLAKILGAARKFASLPLRDEWCGLHSPPELQRIIERERARTDRNGDPFTLVTLSGAGPTIARLSCYLPLSYAGACA